MVKYRRKKWNLAGTKLCIDKNAFRFNIARIKEYVGDNIGIIPVLKANGYGTYLNRELDILNEFEIVAVAMVKEAIELRNTGYKKEILVLNQPYIEEIESIISYDITVGIASKEFINEIIKRNEKIKIHLEIETGMGRTGINVEDIDEYIKILKTSKNVKVEGIYTHLSSTDSDEEFTNKQIEIFTKASKKIKKEINGIKYVHWAASNAILNYEKNECNMVRAGIIIYGYPADANNLKLIDLKPVATLKAKISYIKEVEKGTSISYGRTFIADKKMKIATIGIGYADGIRRELSNKGAVVINGKKANIVGRVCMDSFMADITDIPDVKIGDEVYLWDNKIITLEEVAKNCNTINYEILSTISQRVPRVFIN